MDTNYILLKSVKVSTESLGYVVKVQADSLVPWRLMAAGMGGFVIEVAPRSTLLY
jgi:hypothetical protein